SGTERLAASAENPRCLRAFLFFLAWTCRKTDERHASRNRAKGERAAGTDPGIESARRVPNGERAWQGRRRYCGKVATWKPPASADQCRRTRQPAVWPSSQRQMFATVSW